MEGNDAVPKRGPSSPKIIVDTNLTMQNSGAIRPTPLKPTSGGKSIALSVEPIKQVQVVQSENRSKSHSPIGSLFAVKAKVTASSHISKKAQEDTDVPERDTNPGGQLVTNVVVGEDSGYQILSSKDEEAEREKPRKVISTKLHSSRMPKAKKSHISKVIHDHRKDDLSQSLEKAKKLLDVKAAIEKLRLRGNMDSDEEDSDELSSVTSSGSSTGSSDSDIAIAPVTPSTAAANKSAPVNDHCKPCKVPPAAAQPQQHQQQQPHHPQVTSSADEFVWIDSYNRLVELQKLPWTHTDLCKAICQRTSLQESEVIGADLLSRLSYYLQRALVRISREAQRLSKSIGKCGRHEISTAIKVVLSPTLATLAVKACLRAAAMFSISSEDTRQTKSSRAGLLLHVGKMHRWMTLVKVGKFVHEMAAIYLTAGMETIMEDLIGKCLEAAGTASRINSSNLEQTVAADSDYWGLFQPYSHLSSCRTAHGLDMPRGLLDYSNEARGHPASQANGKTLGQVLLTTCVGSVEELEEMVSMIGPVLKKTWQSVGSSNASSSFSSSSGGSIRSNSKGIFGTKPNLLWNAEALRTLYHFVRCSQLEYVGQEGRLPIQELIYERPYMVLPPLVEWCRVAIAFAEHRNSTHLDHDDVLQAARILLPGMDCPVRPLENPPLSLSTSMSIMMDELEYVNHVKKEMALHMLQTGRRDLVPHALQMLPGNEKVNTTNNAGLTPLQMASLRGDTNVVRLLLDTGANTDGRSMVGENKNWTALNYAVINGHHRCAKLLLDRGAHVEGGALIDEIQATETPLQLAAATGSVRMVELLLASGASAFRSTTENHHGFASTTANSGGCYSAVSVAATHGHKKVLNLLVSHALTSNPTEASAAASSPFDQVLSLEEILAEGASSSHHGGRDERANTTRLVKSQVKKLQEAMYHASEATNLELTLDLRNLGVPWTMHTWMQSLTTANETGLVSVINELLQDFTSSWPEENSPYFVDVGLPLLFNILKTCKTEGTVLLLADIICACFGRELIEPIEAPKVGELGQPRIDPKFINNPELSDVSFRVEGRLFYAHKLVLVTASSRFQSMLNSRFCEGNPPVLQINDIRYDIFQLVMTYLYQGGSQSLHVEASDVLELMAAANFFQLPGLLRYCEHRCSKLVDLDNIVSYYIHAKVYSAVHLLEFCEGFLMQNMVALLTYDDSVKRLLFGKKLQNHDVLSGLLTTLQVRLQKKSE